MKPTTYNSRVADKFVVRLPDGMRDKIADRAREGHRSMNSHIVRVLQKSLDEGGNTTAQIGVGVLVFHAQPDGNLMPKVIHSFRIEDGVVTVRFEGYNVDAKHVNDVDYYPVDSIYPFTI